jgi:hypothetical protein
MRPPRPSTSSISSTSSPGPPQRTVPARVEVHTVVSKRRRTSEKRASLRSAYTAYSPRSA